MMVEVKSRDVSLGVKDKHRHLPVFVREVVSLRQVRHWRWVDTTVSRGHGQRC